MYLIWYNPDLDKYQQGSLNDYDRVLISSKQRDRFEIMFEFNATSARLIDKILHSLNLGKKQKLTV